MKQKNSLWSDVSKLVIAILATIAFLRGTAQLIVLIAAFAIWASYASYRYLIPYIKGKFSSYEAKKLQRHYDKQEKQTRKEWDIDISDPVSLVLIRHINYRISAYLKSVYPDATWSWCCNNPEKTVCKGGTERIKLNGISDFNYAEVTFNPKAEMDFQLLNIVPFDEKTNEEAALGDKKKKTAAEINPQIWFEQKGKKVLTGLIADLHSHGHSSLTIDDDGCVIIQQGDRELKQPTFDTFPDRVCWTRLSKVLESSGITNEITKRGIVISW